MMHVKNAEQVNVRKLLHTDECYIYLLLELCDRVNSNCDLWEYLDLIFDQLSDLLSQILNEMELSLPKLPSILPSGFSTLLLSVLTSAYPGLLKPSPYESDIVKV